MAMRLALLGFASLAMAGFARSQAVELISGTVLGFRSGMAVDGATVVLVGTLHVFVTGPDGRFVLGPVSAGSYVLEASAPGYRAERSEAGAGTELRITLHSKIQDVRPAEPAFVWPLRVPSSLLTLAGATSRFPGAEMARRGGLDAAHVVRGLWMQQVGVMTDGMHLVPSRPHNSPLYALLGVDQVEMVPGPYALTWGPGLLSALRVRTAMPEPGGQWSVAYGSRYGSVRAGGYGAARLGPASVLLQAAYLSEGSYPGGQDAVARDGMMFLRQRAAINLSKGAHLSLAAAYTEAGLEHPPAGLTHYGAIRRGHASGAVHQAWPGRLLRAVDLSGGWQRTGGREAGSSTMLVGMVFGRVAAQLAPAVGVAFELGVDGRSTSHGSQSDYWRLRETGLFAQGTLGGSRLTSVAAARMDFVRARDQSLAIAEFYLSGAASATAALTGTWQLSLGAGTVARTAGVHERFGTASPFVQAPNTFIVRGKPNLGPERSWQVDMRIRAHHTSLATGMAIYLRHLDGYISISSRDAPAYGNGDAIFWGGELWAERPVAGSIATAHASVSYLRGFDHATRESVFAVTPASFSLGIDAVAPGELLEAGAVVTGALRQGHVARELGESPTPGFVTADMWIGLPMPLRTRLHVLLRNAGDTTYGLHVSGRSASGARVVEPGRTWVFRLARSL